MFRENFPGKINLFSSISRLWSKFCGISDKTFSAELSKLHFTSTEKRFEDCFLEKRIFFSSFSNVIYKNLSNFWRQYFRKLVKVEVCVSRGKSCRNIIFEKKTFSLLSYFEQKPFGLLTRNVRQICQKCNLSVQGNNLRRKIFFRKKYVLFARFWTSSQTVSTLWRKFFNTLVEFAFYVSSGVVWEKKLWKGIFLFNSPTLVKDLRFRAKKSVGLSYLMSRCPTESFEEKKFSKSLKFFIIFVHWPQNISASRQKHFIKVVKKAFYVS